MGKAYTVDLPVTQTRELRYTRAERLEFEKRCRHFGLAGMKDILFKKVFPVEPDPANDNKPTPTGGGDLEAQILLVWLGIRHNSKALTEERVADLLELAVKEGRPTVTFVAQAVNAVMASGVLGFVWDGAVVEEEAAPATPGEAQETA
jgi:hypothetical protein